MIAFHILEFDVVIVITNILADFTLYPYSISITVRTFYLLMCLAFLLCPLMPCDISCRAFCVLAFGHFISKNGACLSRLSPLLIGFPVSRAGALDHGCHGRLSPTVPTL